MYLYVSFVGYYYVCQDFDKGYEFARKCNNLFEQNPVMIVSEPENYVKSINNLLVAEFKLGRYNDFVVSLEKFDNLTAISELNITDNIQLMIFKYATAHHLNKYFLLGQFTEGIKAVDKMGNDLEKYKESLDNHYLLILYYKMACMYIGSNNYSKAVQWLNRIINARDEDIRSDIQCFARILNLLCHNELGNQDLVDYYIKSTYRFLLKKDDMHFYQTTLIRFLKKLPKVHSNLELIKAYANLKEQMLFLESNPYEKRAFVYFDIISWLESKIERRTVQEVIQEKARKRLEKNNNNQSHL
jgi:tetratricopeptide (TPR) repeat protein